MSDAPVGSYPVQLLHLVIGGELKAVDSVEFRDLSQVDFVGAYPNYDSAFRARTVFGVQELLVVTQAYHLPRAVATCRALGLRAEGVGDVSVRRARRAWFEGAARDQVACVKTVLDLATRRQPVLGPPQTSVAEALTLDQP